MNPKQRQEYIIDILKTRGSITTNELVEELQVSKMTIGRDLKELELLGTAELFHGGAMYKKANIVEYPILMKKDFYVREKKQIAKAAFNEVTEGSSIFLETGTTVFYTALELINKNNCSFYTNSLSVLNHFAKVDASAIHVVPGKYRALSDGFVGIETVDYLKNFYFDYCFIGTEGLSQEGKISVYSEEDALTKKNVLAHSKHKILLLDKSKIGKKLLYSVATIADFDTIITDYTEMEAFLENEKKFKKNIIVTSD